MAKIRRNGPCPCGSGSKAKRLELDRKRSAFFLSSVVKSLAVLAGDRSTPTGLIVATG